MNAPLRLRPPPLEPVTRTARLSALLRRWWRRWSTRGQLAELSREQLRDIGITHGEALREAQRPFWRGGVAQQQSQAWWERPSGRRQGVVELDRLR